MGFRDELAGGAGWLPPTARLVRGSGEVLFIEPGTMKTQAEVRAYASGWFARAFQPAQYALTVGRRHDLDPDIDADLIRDLDARPDGTWIAFGIAYRFPGDPAQEHVPPA
ncbi:hypothetical protein [Actinomadura roseirufa]|uniref:hypothetical protein n=1 Tax=Actinomadura roseirufa TaxID=2094049 RepID=UPI0010418C2A|nr:hypothetical protein [Actinomadura roseirufa]